jgi:hypothetical protein
MPQIRFKPPFIGINRNLDTSTITAREAEDCLNANLDKGTLLKRDGWGPTSSAATGIDLSAGAVLGAFDWTMNDGTHIRLVHTGGGTPRLKRIGDNNLFENVDDDAGTDLATDATNVMDFQVMNNRCYFCDGTVFKVTDGLDALNGGTPPRAYDPQIESPDPAPSVAASGAVGAGALLGTYDYKITFYSSSWGQESFSSVQSASVELNEQDVSITAIDTTTDVRADFVRIYRRKVSSGEVLWTFVKQIAEGTTSTTDDRMDNDLLATRVAPLTVIDTVSWIRTGVSCEVTRTGHGYQDNDVITVSNSSDVSAIPNGTKTIAVTGADTFTFLCNAAGATSGSLDIQFTTHLPRARFLAQQGGVMFAAGFATQPTVVYHTIAGHPWVMDEFFPVGGDGDDDEITGLFSYQGLLLIFKRKSIWSLSGNSPDTFFLRRIYTGVGCRSNFSLIQHDDTLYWLAERGIYSWNLEGEPVEVSEMARPIFTGRNYSRDQNCVVGHDFKNGALIWSFSSAGSSTNDTMMAYFYRNSRRVAAQSWSPWRLNRDVSTMVLWTTVTTRVRELWYGFEGGIIGKSGGVADDSAEPGALDSSIEFLWRTGKIDGGIEERVKIWRELSVEATTQASSSIMNVNERTNGAASSTLIATHNHTDSIFRRRVRRSSRDLRIEFQHDTATPAEITAWALTVDLAGRA